MTAKTYHTSLSDAILDGWIDAVELPINGGEIHSHGLRCYVKSPRRVMFLKMGLQRGRMTANEIAEPLGMKLPFQVHQFLHHLKFQLTVEKSPIRVNVIKDGRFVSWEVIDKRRQNEKKERAN